MSSQDDKTVTVVRIIRYTGTEEAVRACLSKSLAPGIHQRVGYDIAVSTHTSDLPELDYLCPSAVDETLAKAKPIEPSGELGTSSPGPFTLALEDFLNERNIGNGAHSKEEILHAALLERPVGCCCPPEGHTGLWGAGRCPVHQGFRRAQNTPVKGV